MKLTRRTILRFTQGTSDKVYEVDLVKTASENYLVNFRYGKYGANLREGCKTKSAVELAQATKIADSLLVSKINKGYCVVEGYDPISQELIGEHVKPSVDETSANNESSAATNNERDNKIIARLERFSFGHETIIDGYTLGRTIWKVGELRLQAARPMIEKILTTASVKKDPLDYYSILWTLGRIANEESLHLIDKIAKKLPENTEYMLTEVKMALASQAEQYLPVVDKAIDVVDTAEQIKSFDLIEQISVSALSPQIKDYRYKVLELHNISTEINNALEQLKIEDLIVDNKALTPQKKHLYQHLEQHIVDKLEASEAFYPTLEQSINCLLEHKKNSLIDARARKYKPDYDLYMSLIAEMDLSKVLSDDYDIQQAQAGRLDWIWGGSKAFKKALKKSPKVKNIQSLWQRVIHYSDIASDRESTYKQSEIKAAEEMVKTAGVYEDVLQAIEGLKFDDYLWSYKNEKLSNDTKSKYANDFNIIIINLISDKYHTLKEQALQPKKVLLGHFQQTALVTYWASSYDVSLRSKVLGMVRAMGVKDPFTQTFRRLYKIAEFRDDAEIIAILNYRVEATSPSPSSYWSKSKPFSKPTKEYFRRRLVRTLRHIASLRPALYPLYAREVLLQADDKDTTLSAYNKKHHLTHFPRLLALNFILHKNSILFSENSLRIWRVNRGVKKDIARPEAYPSLWDQAEQDLLAILLGCKASIVNNFAFDRLSKKEAYLKTVAQSQWLKLVQRPYENTALLALDYLQDSLDDINVIKAILAAQFDSVRKKALQALDGERLGEQRDLLVLMLLSEHDDVYEFAKSYLYTAQDHYKELSDQLLHELLSAEVSQQGHYAERIEWLLLHPLKDTASLAAITPLLAQAELAIQLLGAKLLEASSYSFDDMQDSYQRMSESEYPEIRAGAIALLAKLPTEKKIQHKALLFKALLDEHASLRQKSRAVIATIDDQDFRIACFDYVLPSFFKAEPFAGFFDDMLALVVILAPMHKEVDIDLLWRLLNAKSKLAEWSGAIILSARQANEFSVKQLALLSKNPTVSVRDWSLAAFEADLSLTKNNYSQAIRLLDNRWDDTRSRAIRFFQDNFVDDFWNSQRTIAVCDNVYADVQRFGRDLVTRFFHEGDGEEYLLKLSQHPSANVQLFVSGFLTEYASNQTELILSLQPYFKTVLSQVNRGRLIKDRIIRFLFDEANKQEAVATMVAALFSDQSVSMVIADKMQYIKTLFKLQQQFTQIQTPVVIIEPEVRAI